MTISENEPFSQVLPEGPKDVHIKSDGVKKELIKSAAKYASSRASAQKATDQRLSEAAAEEAKGGKANVAIIAAFKEKYYALKNHKDE